MTTNTAKTTEKNEKSILETVKASLSNKKQVTNSNTSTTKKEPVKTTVKPLEFTNMYNDKVKYVPSTKKVISKYLNPYQLVIKTEDKKEIKLIVFLTLLITNNEAYFYHRESKTMFVANADLTFTKEDIQALETTLEKKIKETKLIALTEYKEPKQSK